MKKKLWNSLLQLHTKAYDTMATYYGSVGEPWNWGYVMDNDIDHVGQIPGLEQMMCILVVHQKQFLMPCILDTDQVGEWLLS